jgi:lipopolysaccharide/colanic/teichoic acid biosynthesis glycosyltransferase
MGGPVIFRQFRPGLNEKPFQLLKFRTMSNASGIDGIFLPDEARLTGLGQLLRETSLDELPELWNVVRGDMSLVGPRPLLIEYLPLYNDEQRCRHRARPGITGWAQVHGRNALTWEEKFKLDIWYVNNRTFWIDLKILFLTIKTVLLRKGINAVGCTTTDKFKGSPSCKH